MRIARYNFGGEKIIQAETMKTGKQQVGTSRRFRAWWFAPIVLTAVAAGMFASWRAPALNLYAQDSLLRTRGAQPAPDDVVIVAIDDQSAAKLGRFPWARNLTAQVLNNISSGEPKAVALDVLYSEPTDDANDRALTDAIKRAKRVVIGEQLVEDRAAPQFARSVWLKSIPEIEQAAAGAGHVNVETEADGAARELLLRLADDEGEPRWALALETVRVGDGSDVNQTIETNGYVCAGTRRIPITATEHNLIFKKRDAASRTNSLEPLRMTIDYIGPTNSFAAQTYSFADVLDGKIAPEKFRGKYVLIGATAATLGDKIAAPFVHTENADADQHGDLMPGVEILANEINTILRRRFYQPVSDWTTALLTALVALAAITLLDLAQGRYEAVKQIAVSVGLFALILGGSYAAFTQAFVIPPTVPMLAALIVAAPLALLRRSLIASLNLDERIAELAAAGKLIFINPSSPKFPPHLPKFTDETDSHNLDRAESFSIEKFGLPRGIEWKTQALGVLSRDLIERAVFIDSALRSIEDGLLIADLDGRIAFANRSARRIFDLSERRLLGRDVFELLAAAEHKTGDALETRQEILLRLFADREIIERETSINNHKGEPHFYIVRMTAVANRDHDATNNAPLGLIVTLSDITQHRKLQQTKNDVIALVTHELRTPLTAIQGMSEVLTEHRVEPEPQRKMLLTINDEAKRLARMINEYLDITRLEAGAQKINFAPVNLEALLERTLLMLEPLAAQREIKITNLYLSDRTVIRADAERFAQMLTNIVGNAIKYSPAHSAITIETRTVENELQILVADQGDGISAEQLPHIFEKFYRVPQRGATVTGTGLGLALAQEIAELHNGRITAESELGRGSIFTIHLSLNSPE